jgi:mannose-6-phosphate isomerase-like protein (cupin superfamily)
VTTFEELMSKLKEMKSFDPDKQLPEQLVVGEDDAHWLGPEVTGNPSRIGVVPECPARTMSFVYQEIPAGEATDLQRHAHESVHFVVEGSGYSEIGEQTVPWSRGDLVYTPPWAWHRHYSDSEVDVRMLLVENSGLLDFLGVNRRESAGLVSFAEFKKGEQ